MNLRFAFPYIILLHLGIQPAALAESIAELLEHDALSSQGERLSSRHASPIASPLQRPISNGLQLRDIERPNTNASPLLQPATETSQQVDSEENLARTDEAKPIKDESVEVIVEGQRQEESTPVYIIETDEIQQQGANSVSEVLRNLPGFAINDVGFGADIHTGTYYRGASINQSVFLLNGRPIGSNINTYHGATDLNSIPVGAIDRVELSSGGSATLYGSEAFGGVVNIITKQGTRQFKADGLVQVGSYDQLNYRAGVSGSAGFINYIFSYEKYKAENQYRVPIGAANRGPDGRLFNGDIETDNYYGSLVFNIDSRNTLSLDGFKTTSRRGLLYFGFPLQRDRLDHDTLNIGLSWRTLLGAGDNSILKTTLSFNQDYFSTYGPTRNIFYRTGVLDSRAFNARVEHDWQILPNNNLKWGLDLQNSFLTGDILSNVPDLARFNEKEERDRFHAALFALNTWQILPNLQAELGLRQNFNSEFGNSLNPSVGVRWAVTPAIALRGSWLSVHRNPGLDQLYVFDTVHNWQPNPDLEPETGSSWTAGVDVTFSPSFTGQFTYFGSRLRDRIAVQAGRWTNVGLVNTNGFEVALRWQILPQWTTFLNYTYTDAEIKTGLEKGLQLGLIPFSIGQFGIGYASNGWQVNFLVTYNSGSRRAFFTLPGDAPTDFSPSWVNLDLSAQIPMIKGLNLLLYLENLADKTYEKANRIYQPGLTFRIGLQATF